MDNLVQTIITQLPNLGVAVWMLWQQQQTIKAMLDTQTKLIDRLLTYVDADKQQVKEIVASSATAPERTNGIPR